MADKLNHVVQVTQTVVGQCQQVVSGNRRIPDRIISIFDTDARPIRKSKLKQPTEFGEKVVIADTDDRFITHYEVHKGNPPDESLLLPALQGHADKMGRVPCELATDRGFYSKANEERCREVGIHHVSLPYRGKKSKKRQEHERQSWFRRLQRWRSGQEGVISYLKRSFGMGRSRLKGHEGAKIWVGFGVLAHNLRQMSLK